MSAGLPPLSPDPELPEYVTDIFRDPERWSRYQDPHHLGRTLRDAEKALGLDPRGKYFGSDMEATELKVLEKAVVLHASILRKHNEGVLKKFMDMTGLSQDYFSGEVPTYLERFTRKDIGLRSFISKVGGMKHKQRSFPNEWACLKPHPADSREPNSLVHEMLDTILNAPNNPYSNRFGVQKYFEDQWERYGQLKELIELSDDDILEKTK